MGGTDGGCWDDDRLMALVAEVLDEEAPSGTSAPEAPAELSLEDVVAAGRAAFCWLDVVVWLRNVERHRASVTRVSTTPEPGD